MQEQDARPHGAFISRQRELSELRRALEEARRRHGQMALVSGEAGIGKSRLAQELASGASRTMTVMWGRCVQDNASPPYWPWAQIIGSFAERCSASTLRRVLGIAAGPLQLIVPQLGERLRLPAAPTIETNRFQLFSAVHTFLQRASRHAPILLILEDLHWADQNSLLLLELIVQELAAQRVLVVGTYRDNEVGPPLAQTLGELGRVGAKRIALTGLTAEETGQLITRISRQPLSPEMVNLVHARTGGNPLFVTEIARLPSVDAVAIPATRFRPYPLGGQMKRLLAVLSLCLVAASCQEGRTVVSNPIGPTPPILQPPPKPPMYPPESWTLNTSITSVTPHPCFRDVTGLTLDYALMVSRAEPMRLFVYWDPTDGIEYIGSLSGRDFSLAGSFNRGNSFSIGCVRGGQVEVVLTGRVSGHFSDDGRSISAEEVISYLVVRTGEQVEVRHRWAATAPAAVTSSG